jgi:primosomal replication protein N
VDQFISTAGVVGKSPETKQTPKGEVLEFSLAVGMGYDKESPTVWYDVSVWNEGLQKSVKREISKGSKIAVSGKLSAQDRGGRTYLKIQAGRVGLIEWLLREQAPAPAAAPAAATPAPADDLDF